MHPTPLLKSTLRTRYWVGVAVLVGYLIGLAALWPGLQAPTHGDEGHFRRTVLMYLEELTLETLRTYPEMSGPLPFALYAAWAALWQDASLATLRLCALLIALCTGLVLWAQLVRSALPPLWQVLAGAWLLLYPYFAGTALYVYTDMSALGLLALAWLAASRGHWRAYALWLALALLCRQYLLFLPMALAAHHLWQGQWRSPALWAQLWGTLPLIMLMAYWQGAAPDSPVRTQYLTYGLRFAPEAVWVYLIQMLVLGLPLWLWALRSTRLRWPLVLAALALAQLYWLWPVQAAPISQDEGYFTVGLLDKVLHRSPTLARHLAYVGLLAMALWVLASVAIQRAWHRQQAGWVLLAFLLLMPFSYLIWEKYALPIWPVLVALACTSVPVVHKPCT